MTTKNRAGGIAVVLAVALVLPVHGEIHIRHYKKMQKQAPEVLKIEVVGVDKGWCFFCRSRDIEIEARVREVLRSQSGLKQGARIVIEYEHFSPSEGWAGPRPVPVLIEGVLYPAFVRLNKDKRYVPAAKGYSFSALISLDGKLKALREDPDKIKPQKEPNKGPKTPKPKRSRGGGARF
jgi:hypothetical protein